MQSLRRKIQVGYYAFAAAVASLALLAYSDLTDLERNLAPDLAASRLLDTVLEIRRYEKNWFLYGGDGALAEVRAFAEQARNLIGEARPSLAGLGGQAALDQLGADLAVYLGTLAEGRQDSPPEGDSARAAEVRRAGRRLAEGAEAIAGAQHARLQAAIAQSRATLLANGVLAVLLALVAARWLTSRTTRPLVLLVEKLEAIAKGRYHQVAPISQDQEILAVTTAVNRMLAELEARRRHLVQAEKLSSLGTLVSGVAHELNNPLSNVSSSCQILAEELETGDRQALRQWVQQIDGETERARLIVRSLLDFSREGDFHKRPVRLRTLCEQTLFLVTRLAKGARVQMEIPKDLTVAADPQRLQQVLVNLIRNALDAGGPAVQVALSAQVTDGAGFRLPEHSVCGRSGMPVADLTRGGGRLVLITVEDRGPGIPPSVLPRIFDPFFTTKDVGHGSGLGLYVSQEIIHQHGGCIGVESRPGVGTRFLIALPDDRPADAP